MNDWRDEHDELVLTAEKEFPRWKELIDIIAELVGRYGRVKSVSILHFALYEVLYHLTIDLALGRHKKGKKKCSSQSEP